MKLYYTVIFSLLAHLSLYSGLDKWSESQNDIVKKKPLQIVVLDDSKDYRIVRNPITPEPDAPLDEKIPNLLSEKNQRFKRQQRAAQIDKTVNRGRPDSATKAQQDFQRRMKAIARLSDFSLQKIQRPQQKVPPHSSKNRHIFERSNQPSTINDPLTDVPIGSFTALNTNRYLYYTYFRRIEDRVRFHWVSNLYEVIRKRPTIQFEDRDKKVWTSQVEIILDDKGEFVRADVMKTSGITELDFAAIDAFREGAPIPNPPEGLIDPAGLIHLDFSFSFYWQPNYYNVP